MTSMLTSLIWLCLHRTANNAGLSHTRFKMAVQRTSCSRCSNSVNNCDDHSSGFVGSFLYQIAPCCLICTGLVSTYWNHLNFSPTLHKNVKQCRKRLQGAHDSFEISLCKCVQHSNIFFVCNSLAVIARLTFHMTKYVLSYNFLLIWVLFLPESKASFKVL